uniref:AB hydrolase-1 domain-containing protein n=1 Tax=Kalanchoe fedtschenkoi TaxID=63787 RepID=A0A7N1A1T3_KALFE
LGLQRVSARSEHLRARRGPPVLLQHGLFTGGDSWFLNSEEQSLGFLLADSGFDVWVGNVRGTRYSQRHVSLSVSDKEFWNWSWEELALNDLAAMIDYVHAETGSKVFVVGHSQGTIMSLAVFTQLEIVQMVAAAALLCPISYLEHVTAPLVLRMVAMHLDQMVMAMGIHQLNFRSEIAVELMDFVCDGHLECSNLLGGLTGKNCCFNDSRVDFYLEYEPHPSSSKNMNHLFQMIRKGTFAKYDYGRFKNLKLYGQSNPPAFDLNRIPDSLPLWTGYGGSDGLADLQDVKRTLRELPMEPERLFIQDYGHLDFVLSTRAKEEVFDKMIAFFRSCGSSSSVASI